MPLHVSVSFETIVRGSMAVLRYVTELKCRFTFVIKSVGMWLYVSSFCNSYQKDPF